MEEFVESAAAHGLDVVTHGAVEDAAFAVTDGEEHGFVALGLWRHRGALDFDVFGGAAEFAVEFVFGVEPFGGESFGDGVLGVDVFDEEGGAGAVAATAAFGGVVTNDLAVHGVEPGAVLGELPSAPTADSDHFVIFLPLAE